MVSSIRVQQTKENYRWVMLALCVMTPLFVITLPNMSLPPMFAMISEDLSLSLVEVGVIWGIGSFTGIFFSFIGGTLGDRFGTRNTLLFSCFLTGLFGLGRSFSFDFGSLLLTSLLYGTVQSIISIMLFKVIRKWFPAEQLGMASGFVSAGFAAGLTLGPLISTSIILPALGGWRQVLVLYGVISMILSILWLIVHPPDDNGVQTQSSWSALVQNLRHVMRLRNLWILGIAGLGMRACFSGFSGYLPTYLKAVGWDNIDADRALAAFFLASLIAVIPLSILSDRLHLRRGFLIITATILAIGIGSLGFIDSSLVIVAVAITGVVFDGFMAILNTTILEVRGVGHLYAGSALGFANMIRNLGGTFSPAAGNSLAPLGANVPFMFWGAMGLFSVFMFVFVLKMDKPKVTEILSEGA